MELMKKMIMAACLISIILTVADSVKPGDKFNSQLKLIFSLVFICGVLGAAIRGGGDIDFEVSFDAQDIEGYEDISAAAEISVTDSAERSIEETVCEILKKNDVQYEKITVDVNIDGDNCININEIGYKGDEFTRAAELIKSDVGNAEVKEIE